MLVGVHGITHYKPMAPLVIQAEIPMLDFMDMVGFGTCLEDTVWTFVRPLHPSIFGPRPVIERFSLLNLAVV